MPFCSGPPDFFFHGVFGGFITSALPFTVGFVVEVIVLAQGDYLVAVRMNLISSEPQLLGKTLGKWNLYNAATLRPEKSDLIIEVAALYLTSIKQPRNRLSIIDTGFCNYYTLNELIMSIMRV